MKDQKQRGKKTEKIIIKKRKRGVIGQISEAQKFNGESHLHNKAGKSMFCLEIEG